MSVAIAFSSKDRVELSKQSIEPLLQPDKFSLYWIDGSATEAGIELPTKYDHLKIASNITGGADAAIVYALTKMLQDDHEYIGLIENDVLLDPDWFVPTMGLFVRGAKEGLDVGAVSPRCYVDRILCQRDGYALMHNLGAGAVIFTRKAATLVLEYYRTGWTTENRTAFAQLCGLDIGAWWAFSGNEHQLTADWTFDRILALHGLASLALTPGKATMIGQEMSLEQQGLQLANEPAKERVNDEAFDQFVNRSMLLRREVYSIRCPVPLTQFDGAATYFPHQIASLGGCREGEWKLKWSQGWGPFAYRTDGNAKLVLPLTGPCVLMMSASAPGVKARVVDKHSGYNIEFEVMQEDAGRGLMNVTVPGAFMYRDIEVTTQVPGLNFYGVMTRGVQVTQPGNWFDYSVLPRP
ncbi:MAG TPA: hypothetical protein VMH83_03980 [Candidatus Acidoferrum sp.]|nr:hypothetical protein [Candidatus Acidoferrum sp.]